MFVIVALFLVAGALLPWRLRLVCAATAIGIIFVLFIVRLREHGGGPVPPSDNPDDPVGRIRAARAARMGSRRSRGRD